MSTPVSAKRSNNMKKTRKWSEIDISNPVFLKPFDFGWKRELVHRSINHSENQKSDVYYITPEGKKLRSLKEVTCHLTGYDLTKENFTFSKKSLELDDPEKEIIRHSNRVSLNRSLSDSAASRKVTPKVNKISKIPPKLTATIVPLNSSRGQRLTKSTLKASTRVKPQLEIKGKASLSMESKSKVTCSSNTVLGKTQKKVPVLITKYQEKITEDINSPSVSEISKDLNRKTKNNFKRYGLLANCKIPQKTVLSKSSSSSSSDEYPDDSQPETLAFQKSQFRKDFKGDAKVTQITPSGTNNVIQYYLKNHNKPNNEVPLLSSSMTNNATFQCGNENSATQHLFERQIPPAIQFRPSNPSSYGCQTSSPFPPMSISSRLCGPPSSFYQSSRIEFSKSIETILISDTSSSSEDYLNSQKSQDHIKTPLIRNNSDCIIEIGSTESLDYERKYVIGSKETSFGIKKESPLKIKNEIKSELRSDSPVSVLSISSASTEEINIIDEDPRDDKPPQFSLLNSQSPKLYIDLTSSSPRKSIYPSSPFTIDSDQVSDTSSENSLISNREIHPQTEVDNNHLEYRRFKRKTFLKRLKAKKLKQLLYKTISEEKILRIEYWKKKIALKEKKLSLLNKM